jgi:hypothetical protein
MLLSRLKLEPPVEIMTNRQPFAGTPSPAPCWKAPVPGALCSVRDFLQQVVAVIETHAGYVKRAFS